MEQKKIDKREAIMQAAMVLIADQGFHGTPTSQIADKAGTGVGTIYRYFKDKDELIEAIHEQAHALFLAIFAASYEPNKPVRENYIVIFSALIRLFIAHPFEIKFMEQYYNSPYGIEKKRGEEVECDKPLFALFEQGKQQQVIKNFPHEVLMGLSFGPLLFLVRDHLNGFVNLNDQTINEIVESTWDAIKR